MMSSGRFRLLVVCLSLVLPAQAMAWMAVNGYYEVSVLGGAGWVSAGRLEFDRFCRDRTLDLDAFSHPDGPVRVRLTQAGGGAAPVEAPAAEDPLALVKLAAKDFDVIDASGTLLGHTSDEKYHLVDLTEPLGNPVLTANANCGNFLLSVAVMDAYYDLVREEHFIVGEPCPSGGGGAGEWCFIATAAYGTGMADDVMPLRRFRGEVLLKSPWGRSFVDA